MKISLLQENLSKALSTVQRLIPTKPTLPILGNIWFQAESDKIIIGATDLYLGVLTDLPAEVETPGTWAIPGKLFCEAVSMMSPGPVTMEITETSLTIKAKDSKTTLQIQSTTEYPAFPEIVGQEFKLAAAELQQIIDLVGFAASPDVTRPVLTSIKTSFEPESLVAVATDGFRLAILDLAHQSAESYASQLPAKALQEIARLAAVANQEELILKISPELKQVTVTMGSTTVFTRMVEGEFPPYQKIVPSSFDIELTFAGDELMQQLKRAMIFARESSQIIQLQITPEDVQVVGVSPTAGKYSGSLAVTRIQDGVGQIAFNAKYVQDFLQAAKGKMIWFGMTESTKPAMFKIVDQDNYQYVVMPFRLNTAE